MPGDGAEGSRRLPKGLLAAAASKSGSVEQHLDGRPGARAARLWRALPLPHRDARRQPRLPARGLLQADHRLRLRARPPPLREGGRARHQHREGLALVAAVARAGRIGREHRHGPRGSETAVPLGGRLDQRPRRVALAVHRGQLRGALRSHYRLQRGESRVQPDGPRAQRRRAERARRRPQRRAALARHRRGYHRHPVGPARAAQRQRCTRRRRRQPQPLLRARRAQARRRGAREARGQARGERAGMRDRARRFVGKLSRGADWRLRPVCSRSLPLVLCYIPSIAVIFFWPALLLLTTAAMLAIFRFNRFGRLYQNPSALSSLGFIWSQPPLVDCALRVRFADGAWQRLL
mmetsp:Transcript_29912/g.63040  ORF Transcript_29912/g.63040 Transcript_29912/m.63040 type:complete len:350 (+) Transcript_29912:507-1556(+)